MPVSNLLGNDFRYRDSLPRAVAMRRVIGLPRLGVTLMELLAAIVVIGLLTGLLFWALSSFQRRARQFLVVQEIADLSQAFKAYRAQVGAYPIDFGAIDTADELRFFRKAFPRFVLADVDGDGATDYDDWRLLMSRRYTRAAGYRQDLSVDDLDQAEAIVFWLGGLPDIPASSTRLIGFSANPRDPFEAPRPGASDRKAGRQRPFYDFDQTRLTDVDNDGWYEYVPPLPQGDSPPAPYVYFAATSYAATVVSPTTVSSPTSYCPYPIPPSLASTVFGTTPVAQLPNWGIAVPYVSHVRSNLGSARWLNHDSFQIISAGADQRYGSNPIRDPNVVTRRRYFPSGINLTGTTGDAANDLADFDNLTNFATQALGDALQ